MGKSKNLQYQQNIDIMKKFFRKPIVPAAGIVSIVSVILIAIVDYLFPADTADLLNTLSNQYGHYIFDFDSNAMGVQFSNRDANVFSIDIFSVLTGVAFILLFAFSKSKSNSIQGGAKFFKILSQITYVLGFIMAVVSLLCVIFTFTLPVVIWAKALLIVFFLVFGAFFFISGYSQLKFAKSITENMSSIYLSNTGAKMYAVIKFISGAFYLISLLAVVFVALISGSDYLWLTVNAVPGVLMLAGAVTQGIMAVKYHSYVDGVCKGTVQLTVTEQAEENEDIATIESQSSFCSKCGNPITEEDIFCNICGNKVN